MSFRGNILIITQWSFKDALVQTYTLPYVHIIRKIISPDRKIILITAEQPQVALTEQELNEINTEWAAKNMRLVAQPYKRFGWRKMVAAARNLTLLLSLVKKEKIKIIHAFCTPAGSIAYLLSKLTGASLVIDSYEPHAESMVENGTWKKNGMAFRILSCLEKLQTKRAAALIATTAGMKQYALEKYGVEAKQFFTKPACVDLKKFEISEKDIGLLNELGLQDKIVCVYAGKLGGIYYKDEVFAFVKKCYDHWQDQFRFLLLTNAAKKEIEEAMTMAGLPENIVISRFVYHHEISRYLSLGDFALNPVKPVPTKRFCTSIKDGEYWAMGLPVLIPHGISDDSAIIESEKIGEVMDFNDKAQYITAIRKLELLVNEKPTVKQRIRAVAETFRSFSIAEKIYTTLYK
jgi:hypothetical protein